MFEVLKIALDGVIDGLIFPTMRDRAILLSGTSTYATLLAP